MDHPSLAWVIVDGVPTHVSAFASVPPRRRPRAYCPQCARRLTLKLGSVRRHHAAHDPGEVCATTQPETALHVNVKLALASALRGAAGPDATLRVLRTCAGPPARDCKKTLTLDWLRDWDEVVVEHRVTDSRRPDIVLRRAGTAIGAIEVVVTHAVSTEMGRALEELGVPWIEIRAVERLAEPGAWTPAEALDVAHTSDQYDWRCDEHRALHAAAMAAADARRAAERETARHGSVLLAARVVDVYTPGGARERWIYRVTELSTDGRAHTVRLQCGGIEVATALVGADVSARRDAWPQLRAAYDADIARLTGDGSAFVDSPMRWASGDAAENIVEEALSDRAGRDPTPLATRFPRRWFYARAQQRWFLPPEMRDVRWDRPAGDPFAAHPAWLRAQATVRDRPAPEGSWSTPVFASRPVAALFRARVGSITPASVDNAMVVVELANREAGPRLAIVVIERATSDAAIESLAESFEADGVQTVWLSHPSDWTAALLPLTWVPAGRDWRGQVVINVDGIGVFRADQFARALVERDRRVSEASIRQQWRPALNGCGARRRELPNGATAERRDGRTARRPNGATAEQRDGRTRDGRTARLPNGATAERRDGRTARLPNGATAERRDQPNGGIQSQSPAADTGPPHSIRGTFPGSLDLS